jgi:hypothetical protein
MKHMKHLKRMKHTELDAGAELDNRVRTEVAGAELIGGTDLNG